MMDVVALGELLIDFCICGVGTQGNPAFEANPGGAPCNLLAMLAQLGRRTAFVGKVGSDMFGEQLAQALEVAGIATTCLVRDSAFSTTLAFVKNLPDGDRIFSFVRNPGADTQLRSDEVDISLVQSSKIFHFGSLSLTHIPAREATAQALVAARQAGVRISFDPNLRPALWDSMEHAREQIIWGIAQCGILKLSEDELTFVTGETETTTGADSIFRQWSNIELLLITCGKNGSYAFANGCSVEMPASEHVAVDTTGAGDTFFGCCLHFALQQGSLPWDEATLTYMLKFANTAAGIVTTRRGAMSVMPTLTEVMQCLQ